MAVRFDADGESYTSIPSLGTVTNWSAACWVRLATDRAAQSVLWQIDDGSGGSFLRLTAWNGTALAFQTSGSTWFGTVGFTLTVGTWAYVGPSATANPGQARTRIRAAGSTVWSGGSPTQANVTINATALRLGDGANANEWLNGSLTAVKFWDAALTELELEQESWSYLPRRTSNLRGWYPLLGPSTVDYSGAGNTLLDGAGVSADDGPPLTWSATRRRTFVSPPPLVSGTLAGVVPAATATSSAEVTVSGGLAGTVPAAVAAFAGEADVNYLAGVVPAATASMAATVEVSGSASMAVPAVVGAFVGEVEIPPNDITVTTSGAERGWMNGPIARAWTAGKAARGWTSGTPTT